MKSWVPCYSLISVGIFKFFSWPPSEAAGLKRDIRNKGKKVKPLQIPPPTSSFAVSAPLICVASDSWGDTGTKQWQISYWACPGQSRGLNGLQGWQEKVIEAFAGGLGEEKGEWSGVPYGRSISELRTCWWWNCYFLPKVKNPNWYMEQKNGISYSRGKGSHTMETKGKECRKWKDFIPSPASFEMEAKDETGWDSWGGFQARTLHALLSGGEQLEGWLVLLALAQYYCIILIIFLNTLYALQDVWKHSSSRHQWGGTDRNIKAY